MTIIGQKIRWLRRGSEEDDYMSIARRPNLPSRRCGQTIRSHGEMVETFCGESISASRQTGTFAFRLAAAIA